MQVLQFFVVSEAYQSKWHLYPTVGLRRFDNPQRAETEFQILINSRFILPQLSPSIFGIWTFHWRYRRFFSTPCNNIHSSFKSLSSISRYCNQGCEFLAQSCRVAFRKIMTRFASKNCSPDCDFYLRNIDNPRVQLFMNMVLRNNSKIARHTKEYRDKLQMFIF